jgi:hypothetical protein
MAAKRSRALAFSPLARRPGAEEAAKRVEAGGARVAVGEGIALERTGTAFVASGAGRGGEPKMGRLACQRVGLILSA